MPDTTSTCSNIISVPHFCCLSFFSLRRCFFNSTPTLHPHSQITIKKKKFKILTAFHFCLLSLSLSTPSHQIAFHVKEFEKSREFQTQQRNWAVYFVPRRSFICEKVLKDEGVYGSLKLHEYHLGLLPFENDVMSLELSDTLRNCDINGDQTSLFYVARSVLDLQSMFGMCPRLYAKGAMGCSVIEVRLFSFLFFSFLFFHFFSFSQIF